MTAETDLLPCPFCGAAPFIGPLDPEDEGDGWTEISCANDDCPVAVTVEECGPTDDSPHRANAIAAWNTRANLAELQREVEGLRAEVALLRERDVRWQKIANAARMADMRAERLAGALRRMVGASYVVCTTIDPRGHRWCEAYLDEALPEARAALDQETTNG